MSDPAKIPKSLPFVFPFLDGPDKMSLTLGSYTVGSNVTVGCSAESNPPAQMQWAFEGKLLNRSGSVLELYNVTKSQSGYYACVAFNNVTNTNNNITGYVQITGEQISLCDQFSIHFSLNFSLCFEQMPLLDQNSQLPICGTYLCCHWLGSFFYSLIFEYNQMHNVISEFILYIFIL